MSSYLLPVEQTPHLLHTAHILERNPCSYFLLPTLELFWNYSAHLLRLARRIKSNPHNLKWHHLLIECVFVFAIGAPFYFLATTSLPRDSADYVEALKFDFYWRSDTLRARAFSRLFPLVDKIMDEGEMPDGYVVIFRLCSEILVEAFFADWDVTREDRIPLMVAWVLLGLGNGMNDCCKASREANVMVSNKGLSNREMFVKPWGCNHDLVSIAWPVDSQPISVHPTGLEKTTFQAKFFFDLSTTLWSTTLRAANTNRTRPTLGTTIGTFHRVFNLLARNKFLFYPVPTMDNLFNLLDRLNLRRDALHALFEISQRLGAYAFSATLLLIGLKRDANPKVFDLLIFLYKVGLHIGTLIRIEDDLPDFGRPARVFEVAVTIMWEAAILVGKHEELRMWPMVSAAFVPLALFALCIVIAMEPEDDHEHND